MKYKTVACKTQGIFNLFGVLFFALTFFGMMLSDNILAQNNYKKTTNDASDYYVIPVPTKVEPKKGKFLITKNTVITGTRELANEGKFLAGIVSDVVRSNNLFVEEMSRKKEDVIKLAINKSIENEEGYRLTVTPLVITIEGKTTKGLFYGIQTLRQLITKEEKAKKEQSTDFTIPAVNIVDAPRFAHRGMMLDVSRHIFSVDYIKRFIDLLALHKINTFNWHLADDQGWRIEIKGYPELTQVGAYRNGTIVGHSHNPIKNDNMRTGGYYTQEEVKEVVAYASKRHITVIPEIEFPGHASAAIAAYPFLSCFPDEPTVVHADMMSETSKKLQEEGKPKIVQETWGVFDDVYCAGKETTFNFLENILDEMIPLFSGKYLHIGADECPKSNWKRCPHCQARMKKLNLKDEHELQSYFVQRIEKYVNSKGKKIIGFDEILEGGISPKSTVTAWRDWGKEKYGVIAANKGNDVIMSPTSYCYFDYYQVEESKVKNEPLAIGGSITVEKTYGYEPLPTELTKNKQKHILGGQGNLWTEYINSTDQIEYMVFPRVAALAEVLWSPKELRNWRDFQMRFLKFKAIYDKEGVRYAKHILEKKH